MADQGFLVISDISGYSSYVRDSELEHARDSLAALLKILIEHIRSPFAIAKLEGDAVFSYAPGNAFLQGQSLLEMMEGAYVALDRKSTRLNSSHGSISHAGFCLEKKNARAGHWRGRAAALPGRGARRMRCT